MENIVGERLRKLRKSLKLKQEEFAVPIGVTGATISRAESGEGFSLELAKKISAAYNVPLTALIDERSEVEIEAPTIRKAEHEDLMTLLAKIEERWKQDNEYLKERLKAQEETIKSQASTIAAFADKFLKFKATDLEPHRTGKVVMFEKEESYRQVA